MPPADRTFIELKMGFAAKSLNMMGFPRMRRPGAGRATHRESYPNMFLNAREKDGLF
jgi:hypothetical protein